MANGLANTHPANRSCSASNTSPLRSQLNPFPRFQFGRWWERTGCWERAAGFQWSLPPTLTPLGESWPLIKLRVSVAISAAAGTDRRWTEEGRPEEQQIPGETGRGGGADGWSGE